MSFALLLLVQWSEVEVPPVPAGLERLAEAGERLYGDDKGATEKRYTEVAWPAVVAHPMTGRPILFVNPMHVHGFEGMAREEAWPLIEELAEHATQERTIVYPN